MQKFRFNDEVHDYQRFVRENIKSLGDMLLITEQLCIQNRDICIIDILLLNTVSKRLAVLELKNVLISDKMMWQPIRYYDYLSRAEDALKQLLMRKRHEFNFEIDEIDFNPEVILVVPEFNPQLLRSLAYVDGVDLKVVKLNLFIKDDMSEILKEEYIPSSIYHREDLVTVKEKISKIWSFEEYLKEGVDSKKISLAQRYVSLLTNIFTQQNKKLDMFFYEKYISLTVNGKVFGHIYIKKKLYQSHLCVSFKTNQRINPIDFQFAPHIIDYKVSTKKIELCFNEIPLDLIRRYVVM